MTGRTYYEDVIGYYTKKLNIKYLICDYEINSEGAIHISSNSIGLDLDTYSKDKGNLLVVFPFLLTNNSICDVIPYIQQSIQYGYVNKAYMLTSVRSLGGGRFNTSMSKLNFSIDIITPCVTTHRTSGSEVISLIELNTESNRCNLVNLRRLIC